MTSHACQFTSEDFLATCARWIGEFNEILVASQFGAGDRDYLLCRSLDDVHRFCESTAPGYAAANVAALRSHRLELRGIVDQSLIEKATSTLPVFAEYLVLRLAPNPRTGLLGGNACESIAEVISELKEEWGREVAVAEFPAWPTFPMVPPEESGVVCTTVHKRAGHD
jgi:hypothetical protein